MVPDLLEQIDGKVRRFTGDGAYDRRLLYDPVAGGGTADVVVVVPPRRSAVPDKNVGGAWSQRSTHLERIEKIGRRAWLILVFLAWAISRSSFLAADPACFVTRFVSTSARR